LYADFQSIEKVVKEIIGRQLLTGQVTAIIKRALSEDFSSAYFPLMFLTFKDIHPRAVTRLITSNSFAKLTGLLGFRRLTTVIGDKDNLLQSFS
jgi:hypothetical protein